MENIIQAKRERKMTKFKTIINYQIIYRYFILINPLPCVIYFVIAAIFFGLLENQNILWNIILVILLYTIWMILKKVLKEQQPLKLPMLVLTSKTLHMMPRKIQIC